MDVLAADVGGTKTVVARCTVTGSEVRVGASRLYRSRGFGNFDEVLRAFAAEVGFDGVERACFGVAGPVEENRCRTTNLPWVVEGEALASRFGFRAVRVVNDFHAAAMGVEAIGSEGRVEVQAGVPLVHAPRVVIGAGTGLGEALLVWGGEGWIAVPGEGGHGDFAPRNAREDALNVSLRARYGRVSWERVVSGMGLADIYTHLREVEGLPESAVVAAEIASGDPGAVIGTHALAGDDPLSEATLELFLEAYGAEAGNAALRALARGGVFLAGGIAAKVLPQLRQGAFLRGFLDKGRMRDIVAQVPVHVVTEERLGLFGAAIIARSAC